MAAGRKRSKSVSWAPDVNLRQVRLFLSEDAPALSGLASQDHLQTKSSWLWHSNVVGSDDSLPPGFEVNYSSHQPKREIPQIPLIKWQCPYQLVLNSEWLVVAGEESKEVDFQNRRQRGALEAIYPRPSSIPPNPSFPPESADFQYNDAKTPFVPITAIEEEDQDPPCATSSAIDSSTKGLSNAPTNLINPALPQDSTTTAIPTAPLAGQNPAFSGFIPSVEPDVVAAASAAFTAIVKSSDEGSMIDRELLIKILSDPKMIEKLVTECGPSKQASVSQPALPTITPSPPPPLPVGPPLPPAIHVSQTVPFSVPPPWPAPLLSHPWSAPVDARRTTNPIAVAVLPEDVKSLSYPGDAKDLTYYKNLIQQHGGDNPDWNPMHSLDRDDYPGNGVMGNDMDRRGTREFKKREYKQKIAKPCVYFNTPRGCKHGANCMYQHDPSSLAQQIEGRGGKRIKFDR